MNQNQGTSQWQNVWSESQSRGGVAARAFLDMITIPVAPTSASLTSITISDISGTFRSADPSLHIAGITVGYGNTGTAPAAPTSLTAAASGTSIALTWMHDGQNVSGFKVYRLNTSSILYELISTVGAQDRTYTDGSLAAGVMYSYRVKAFNSSGESAFSNTATATTGNGGTSLAVSPTSVQPSQAVTASWSNFSPTRSNWISLHATGAADGAYLSRQSISGSSGSVTFTAPHLRAHRRDIL
ncbi:MAG: fibronectin type III domain-containing protein [Chloroflexi bacterium]|nr:fibronectin type III domain-containing protein [Chloroflexota bacterium]